MKQNLDKILINAETLINNAKNIRDIDDIKVKFLGKKGEITLILKSLGSLDPVERPLMGQLVNSVRTKIDLMITEKQTILEESILEQKISSEKIDVTIPGKEFIVGRRHPLTIVLDEIKEIFLGLGFSIVDGPEVELGYYNFDALNIPENHPARDEQDTFYISKDVVLRTQTSPVQVREMEKREPPIKIIAPGRVYRSDSVDATHSPVFHQIEGLYIDKQVSMADLKGILSVFAQKMYGDDTKIRFRPHHFPFTEPSAEMDVMCFVCDGDGCNLCKGEGFIEILGCGIVHPKVLEKCNLDTNEYTGYAFGMGLERIVMRKYKIDDIRLLFENDVRFLHQF